VQGFRKVAAEEPPDRMETPVYAICEGCAFLRAFAGSAHSHGNGAPERCPVCGREVTVHGAGERFPSAYVARTSRELYATPPLNAAST
jgi:hypothetical protein